VRKIVLICFLIILGIIVPAMDSLATPSSPTMSFESRGLNVTVNWTAVPGASGYNFYYAPYPYTGPASIGSFDMGNVTTFSAQLWEDAAYYVAVKAYDGQEESDYSNVEHFILQEAGYSASLEDSTVTGTFSFMASEDANGSFTRTVSPVSDEQFGDTPVSLFLDDSSVPTPLDAQGWFMINNVADGDHSLFLELEDGSVIEMPFRMAAGKGLNLGVVDIDAGRMQHYTGFNGYRFGWVDENADGANDHFADVNGDGICDNGYRYAGYAYFMGLGYVDTDIDGRNDRFVDADGNGKNDLTGRFYGFGFGFTDENDDGINDHFIDAEGDGINDLSGMPYRQQFGWVDEDGDNVNDFFIDADGDGVNDLMGNHYVTMPGWVDGDSDGYNDLFRDVDGNGVNDFDNMPYMHGFGWIDNDGDGINDHFIDADGDGINDLDNGPYSNQGNFYGFHSQHHDADGNGIDDLSGSSVWHGFGWVDEDGDGINDRFTDANGDGVNDVMGYHYMDGYHYEQGFDHSMGGSGSMGGDGPMGR
jgi:hypothetical protein